MPSRNNELLRGKAAADVSASARICRLIRPRHYNESAPYASRAPDMPPPPPFPDVFAMQRCNVCHTHT